MSSNIDCTVRLMSLILLLWASLCTCSDFLLPLSDIICLILLNLLSCDLMTNFELQFLHERHYKKYVMINYYLLQSLLFADVTVIIRLLLLLIIIIIIF